MDFFNKIGKKINEISSNTVKATKDMSEISKLNSEIKQLKKNIQEAKAEAGIVAVETYPTIDTEKIGVLVDQIHQAEQQINEIQEQIGIIRGEKVCPSCDAVLPADTRFCNNCGAEQEIPEQVEEVAEVMESSDSESTKMCGHCQNVLPLDAKFCNKCGTAAQQD